MGKAPGLSVHVCVHLYSSLVLVQGDRQTAVTVVLKAKC